jgi:mannosylglycoprotein endo-beta-mannosidase
MESAQNLKLLLCFYEKMSGLKINFDKSEVLMISQDCEKAIGYADILNCATGTWPIKYLGVPVSSSKLHISDWVPLDEKMLRRLDGWKGSALSLGGRLILLNSSLSSIPTYYMSMHLLPKTILKRMDRTRKKFFWQRGGEKKKYHLVKWVKVTNPKQKGGLGVKDLRRMNLSLLCRWWWKLEHEEGIWQEIVRKKYRIFKGISELQRKPRNSLVWNDLLKVKQLYLKGRIMIVGNGKRIDFWEDPWCGMVALKDKFRGLYDICIDQNKSVAEMAQRGWRMNFRRWLNENQQNQLRQMRDMLSPCALSTEKDIVKWIWEKSGTFSVKSMYNHLFSLEGNNQKRNCGKLKYP